MLVNYSTGIVMIYDKFYSLKSYTLFNRFYIYEVEKKLTM